MNPRRCFGLACVLLAAVGVLLSNTQAFGASENKPGLNREDLGATWKPAPLVTSVPEATTGFQVPFTNDHYGYHYLDHVQDGCGSTYIYHPGVDFNGPGNDCGLSVAAVANGVVRYAATCRA